MFLANTKAVFKKKPLAFFMAIGVFFLLLCGGILFVKLPTLPSTLIIHFDRFHGIDFFGTADNVWMVWYAALFFSLLNVVLAIEFFYRERAVSYLLLGTNALIGFLLFLFVVTVVSVN